MCFATMALAAGIAGAATSAVGTVMQGQATSKAASYAAQVAANNKVIADQNAKYAEQAGIAQAQATALKGAAAGGRLKAAQAASGIDVNTGSAVDVQAGQRQAAQLDTQTVISNANLQAYGYRAQGMGFEAESKLKTMEAEQAPIGADVAAAGGLLGSASGLGFKWSMLGKSANVGAASG